MASRLLLPGEVTGNTSFRECSALTLSAFESVLLGVPRKRWPHHLPPNWKEVLDRLEDYKNAEFVGELFGRLRTAAIPIRSLFDIAATYETSREILNEKFPRWVEGLDPVFQPGGKNYLPWEVRSRMLHEVTPEERREAFGWIALPAGMEGVLFKIPTMKYDEVRFLRNSPISNLVEKVGAVFSAIEQNGSVWPTVGTILDLGWASGRIGGLIFNVVRYYRENPVSIHEDAEATAAQSSAVSEHKEFLGDAAKFLEMASAAIDAQSQVHLGDVHALFEECGHALDDFLGKWRGYIMRMDAPGPEFGMWCSRRTLLDLARLVGFFTAVAGMAQVRIERLS